MLKIDRTQVWGFEGAIYGMRMPYKSTDQSDSDWGEVTNVKRNRMMAESYPREDSGGYYQGGQQFYIGDDDWSVAKRLANAGTDHGKFMRMIHVQAVINGPLYWWKQFDTYKVGTAANSESTMHTVTKYPFNAVNDFSFGAEANGTSMVVIDTVVAELNLLRDTWLKSDGEQKRAAWDTIIQLLPESYMQARQVDLNYSVLRAMYHSRKGHKLQEWRQFSEWCEELPYAELITGKEQEKDNNGTCERQV